MRRILHILTRPDDQLAEAIIEHQANAGHETRVIDLTAAGPDTDYTVVLEEIFRSDSIQTW
ncbi:MAG: hypothetical protein VX705_02990 [Verrucomicrobiota bacterium]|jgi:hypothetical protein|nr:hypothetical protein [Verrucomicrobiota bacterium]|tara:strand:- start:570 stop:752 length:183 start_codon:yes stop_codon:yes gene_type:complete